MQATEQQKEQALLHATVWDNVSFELHELARQQQVNIRAQGLLEALSGFALIVGSEFRKTVNIGEIAE